MEPNIPNQPIQTVIPVVQNPPQEAPVTQPQTNQAPPAPRNNLKLLFIILVIFIILISAGVGYYFLANKSKTTNVVPAPTPKLIKLTNPPAKATNSGLFKNPNEPAYTQGKGFAPDAQNVLWLVSLQISLSQYYDANKNFPNSLNDLFPNFAPKDQNGNLLTQPPLDAVTNQPFGYQVAIGKQDYQLSATTSTGKQLIYTKSGQLQ